MIKVYKEFDAIQWNGKNTNEIVSRLNIIGIVSIDKLSYPSQPKSIIIDSQEGRFVINLSDWLVYSPYKQIWKKYTNEEFKKDFKTKEEL
jgi:predicted nucleotide-binding protein (sugar kinase/HSP70/actin superfamily)